MEKVIFKASPEEAFFIPQSKTTNIIGSDWKMGDSISGTLKNLENIPSVEIQESDAFNSSGPLPEQEKSFIIANTTEVPLLHLQHDCIIPVCMSSN